MQEHLNGHPNFACDKDRFLSEYAWSDPDEDFAEVFAEVVVRDGRIEAFRRRPGIYVKMRFLLAAGRHILQAYPVLRRCNWQGLRYLFGGRGRFVCPDAGGVYGVPMIGYRHVCPCGVALVHDGTYVKHGEGKA